MKHLWRDTPGFKAVVNSTSLLNALFIGINKELSAIGDFFDKPLPLWLMIHLLQTAFL